MVKFTSIILSVLVFTQSLSINIVDLLQIDEFIEHAKFHKAEYDDHIFSFLSKHYGALKSDHHEKHQEESDDHAQLPFHCQGSIINSLVFTVQKVFFYGDILEFKEDNESEYFYLSSYFYLFEDALLQPPRSA